MLHCFRNDQIIKPQIWAFRWNNITKIFIFIKHLTGFPWEGYSNSCITLNHVALHLITNNSFDIWCQTIKFSFSQTQFRHVLGIQTVTQAIERKTNDFTRTINHHNLVSVFRWPKIIPVLRCFFHQFRIIDNSDCPPEIRNRIVIIGIETKTLKAWANLIEAMDFRFIQLHQKVFLDHLINGVVRRYSDVVSRTTLLNFSIHSFVRIKGFILDFYSCLFSELGQEIRVNVVTPIINNQFVRSTSSATLHVGRNSPKEENNC